MNSLETEPVQLTSPTDATPDCPPRRQKSSLGISILALLLGGGIAAAIYTYGTGLDHVRRDAGRAIDSVRKSFSSHSPVTNPRQSKTCRAWDGLVRVSPDEAKSMGLVVASVQKQTDPIKLELPGRTSYDPNTLTKIRPRFDTLVERVRVELGQKVAKGARSWICTAPISPQRRTTFTPPTFNGSTT